MEAVKVVANASPARNLAKLALRKRSANLVHVLHLAISHAQAVLPIAKAVLLTKERKRAEINSRKHWIIAIFVPRD